MTKTIGPITTTCETCGTIFSHKDRRGRRFCSQPCSKQQWRNGRSEQKFWAHVQKTDTCWIWTGSLNSNGYGHTTYLKKPVLAHRLSYRLTHGDFDEALFVLHSCDNPKCVNPKHLFLGTQLDNMDDMRSKGRGYEFTDHAWSGKRGEDAGQAKLTEAQVMEIKRLRSEGVYARVIAQQFGIHIRQVFRIMSGERWRHLS